VVCRREIEGEVVSSGRAGRSELGLEVLALGGDDRHTSHDRTLCGTDGIGAAQVGQMLMDEVLGPADPWAATVDPGQESGPVGDLGWGGGDGARGACGRCATTSQR
jgi:hypothetical protein